MEIIEVVPNTWPAGGDRVPGTDLRPLVGERENVALVDAPSGNTVAITRQGDRVSMFGALHTYVGWSQGTHLVRFTVDEFPDFVNLRVSRREYYLPALKAARDAVMELIAANNTIPA
jgi:hypothetical protein